MYTRNETFITMKLKDIYLNIDMKEFKNIKITYYNLEIFVTVKDFYPNTDTTYKNHGH